MTSDVTADRGKVVERETYTAPGADVATERTGAPRAYEYSGREATGIRARDRVRWGPVVAGLLTALASFILLSLLATAIGVQSVRSGADAQDAGAAGAITAAIIGLISFFIGGYVAAWAARSFGRSDGALNGFLVWATAVPLILLLAGLGLGGVFGALGDQFGNYRDLASRAEGVDAGAVADAIRNGAVGAFLGMLLPAIAATVGGWIGARDDAATEETARTSNYRMERA